MSADRDRRIAEAVRDACVAEFQTRADALRERAEGYSTKAEGARVMEIVHGLEANAALLRAVNVAAAVATVPAEPDPVWVPWPTSAGWWWVYADKYAPLRAVFVDDADGIFVADHPETHAPCLRHELPRARFAPMGDVEPMEPDWSV